MNTQISVAGKVNLRRSQTNDLVIAMLVSRPYVIANWKKDEPIIHGYGRTPFMAWNCARLHCSKLETFPEDLELCERIVGETMVWQGPSGRRVTVEDFLSVDD